MIWNYIRDRMLTFPEKRIQENDKSITYKDAVKYAENFARNMKASCYAILCESEMLTALALLCCMAANVTAVPLSYKYGEKHYTRILKKINPPCILTDRGGELRIEDTYNGKYFDPPEKRPALIMCTSGTTGQPKGAMLSDENILVNVRDILDYFKIENSDKILIARPIYHCAVLTGEFLVSLAKGLDIFFYSGQMNPTVILNLIRDYGITVMCGTPTIFQLISRFIKSDNGKTLRIIALSGECLGKGTASRIRAAFPEADIYHVYGLTEASPRVAYLPPEYFGQNPESVGRPLKSVEVKVADENGNSLPINKKGELCIKGTSVMMGYYADPDLTERVIRNGWLHTGDIAYIDEQGFIYIKCRKDDMIIRAGMNIYPQEIENSLREDNRVEEVLAYGIADPVSGEKIGLKIKGFFENTEEVLKLCKEKLPSYEWPSYIELTDEIPKNGSGKIIRRKDNV